MSIFQNTCKPIGLGGRIMLNLMNKGHARLHKWGFSLLELKDGINTLDIGCGGGSNLKRVLEMLPNAKALGIDYSDAAIEKSSRLNKEAIKSGRLRVLKMSADKLELPDLTFDFASAFETIYFWPNIERAFKEVYRVLNPGGLFMICNEANGLIESQNKWCDRIEGMKMYTEEDIKGLLKAAGFEIAKVATEPNGFLMVLGKK